MFWESRYGPGYSQGPVFNETYLKNLAQKVWSDSHLVGVMFSGRPPLRLSYPHSKPGASLQDSSAERPSQDVSTLRVPTLWGTLLISQTRRSELLRKAAGLWRPALVSHSNFLWHLVPLGSRSGTMGSHPGQKARCLTTLPHSGCLDIGSQDGNQSGSVKCTDEGGHRMLCFWPRSSDSLNILCSVLLACSYCLCHHQPLATSTTICHGCFDGQGSEFLISGTFWSL